MRERDSREEDKEEGRELGEGSFGCLVFGR